MFQDIGSVRPLLSRDFDGDGETDLLVEAIGGWQVCHSHLRTGGKWTCDPVFPMPVPYFTERPNWTKYLSVKDYLGLGREQVYFDTRLDETGRSEFGNAHTLCQFASGVASCAPGYAFISKVGLDPQAAVSNGSPDIDGDGLVDTLTFGQCVFGVRLNET